MNGERPPEKSGGPWLWIAGGCVFAVLAFAAGAGFLVVVVTAAVRSSAPYEEGLARARRDARVQAVLGAPIEPGWLVSGSIRTENRSGECDLSVPLKGSKRKGVLRIVGTRSDGRWTYTQLLVTPEGGAAIDLLKGERSSAAA
jgi:hypothetical protein